MIVTKVDYEQFCAAHPYRVVGPESLPERRFSTLTSAAMTVVTAGPRFHVECGAFYASYIECRIIDGDAVAAAQLEEARRQVHYWEKIGATQ